MRSPGGRAVHAAERAGRAAYGPVQMLGFTAADQTVTVTAGAAVTVRFLLKQEAVAVAPMVVTALGIESKERSLGYAVQSVSAVAIERSPEVNAGECDCGSGAGVQVTAASGRPGASARAS